MDGNTSIRIKRGVVMEIGYGRFSVETETSANKCGQVSLFENRTTI